MADGEHVGKRVWNRGILLDARRSDDPFARQVSQLCGDERYGGGRTLRMVELGVPRNHVAFGIEPAFNVDQRRRTLRIPAVLVSPHPLHPYGTAQLLCDERSIRSRILMTIAAVAAGTVDVDRTHFLLWQLEHRGELFAQSVRLLAR